MEKIEREERSLQAVTPFAAERAVSVGDMEIEMQQDIISLRGSLNLRVDQQGVRRAEMLADFFARVASVMKDMPLGEESEDDEISADGRVNKFGRAFD